MTDKSCLFIVIFGWEMETHGIRTILSNIMNHMYVFRIYIYIYIHTCFMIMICCTSSRWFTKGTYIYIYRRNLIAWTLVFYTLYGVPTSTETWLQEKAPWVGPKKGSWVKILRPESYWWGNPTARGWMGMVFQRIGTRWWWFGFATFFCFTLVFYLCSVQVSVRFLFGTPQLHHSGVFFVTFHIEMYNVWFVSSKHKLW